MSIDLEKIIKADLAHLIHPLYHLSDAKSPFVWVKGEGSTLWAADGREYIDGLAGLWNVTLGHGRKELAGQYTATAECEETAADHAESHNDFPSGVGT